jgi:rhodanese-related sulfurtransferase
MNRPCICTLVSLIVFLQWFGTCPPTLRADDKPAAKPQVEKIDVDQFDKKRQEKDTVVLDVRTPDEFAAGHVPGAVNLDIHDPQFNDKVATLDKSKTYLVHCAKGYRSGIASTKMAAMGFPSLFDFHGGFTAWENAHKPIEKGK